MANEGFYVLKLMYKIKNKTLCSPLMEKISEDTNCLLVWTKKENAEKYLKDRGLKDACKITMESFDFFKDIKKKHVDKGIYVELRIM